MALKLLRLRGGPSPDGSYILVGGDTEEGPVGLRIERENVETLIARLATWAHEAASKAGIEPQPFDRQDDRGLWMIPTRFGLIDGDEPDTVHLAIAVGPVRFRFALTKSSVHELRQTLQTASAPTDRAN